MDAVIGLALAGGAYALATSKSSSAPAAAPAKVPASNTAVATKVAVSGGTKISPAAMIKAKMKPVTSGPSVAGVKSVMVHPRASTYLNAAPGADYPAEISQAIVDKAKKEWGKLEAAARKAACQKLKDAYPGNAGLQAIDCSAAGSSFQTILKAIAAAAGTAVCVAYGAGVAAPLCGMVAAWIAGWAGPKLEEWANDAYDAAGEVLDSIGSGAESAWHAITPW